MEVGLLWIIELLQPIKIKQYTTVGTDDKEDVSDTEELTRDLMALLASFSGKYYSRSIH